MKSNLPISNAFLLNIQGMNPGITNQRWKVKALQESISSNPIHTPFFTLTETHLKSYHLDAEVHIPGYTCYRADRTSRACGGAATYLHNSITVEETKSFSNSYCELVAIYSKEANIVIAGIYRPPSAPFDKFDECLSTLQQFINGIQRTPVLHITGDFNLPFINWTNSSIDTGCSISLSDRQSALALLNFNEECLLQQEVLEPTRKNNILDLVFSNDSDSIHSISVTKTELSDHDIVSCTLLNPELLLPSQTQERPVFTPSCLLDDINLNSADWDAINAELLEVDWASITDPSNDQDTAWTLFEDKVAFICSKNAPSHSRNIQVSSQSSIPKPRRELIRKKRRLNARINAIKHGVRTPRNSTKLDNLNNERANIEILMKEDIKQERLRQEIAALAKMKINPKAFYSYAKKSAKFKAPVGPLADDANNLQCDPTVMGNILQKQYQKAFSNPENVNPDNIPDEKGHTEELSDITFSVDDVLSAIKETGRFSAPGPDKFPALILRECKDALAPTIAKLWQLSFDTSDIAEMFRSQSIIPIFKKGSKAVAANYRPVSLTSHLIKLCERIMRNQMVSFLERNNMFNPDQHGFQKGKNCLTQLLHHIEDIICDLNLDKNADVLYLDFSKAFDKVDHKILLKKIQAFGIRGKLYDWIASFLTGRKQHVIVDGVMSTIIDVISGVPQGTVLGPLLFLIYIDDIFSVVKHSKIKVFADDSKLHKDISSHIDRILLQEDLLSVVNWADVNNMELNEEKFQLLQHGKLPDLKQPYILPSGETLKGSDHVKDLGVYIDPDLNWRTHIAMKSAKARNMASWVLRTFISRDVATMMLLYKSYVRSHLEYCCPLWSPHMQCEIIKLEAVQRSFTAKIQGLGNLNYWERLRRLSMYSLQRRRERYTIILVWKIYNNLSPNSMNINFRETSRYGTTCIRPLGSSKYTSVNNLRFNSFASRASALYNVVPPAIKSLLTLTTFKPALDAFLNEFPDTPPTPGYTGQNRNSMLEWAGGTCL